MVVKIEIFNNSSYNIELDDFKKYFLSIMKDLQVEDALVNIIIVDNEEIKKIFREQNLNISDAEIDNFRKNFLTSMPKNQVQIEKKIEKLKNLDIDTSKIIHEKAKEINR